MWYGYFFLLLFTGGVETKSAFLIRFPSFQSIFGTILKKESLLRRSPQALFESEELLWRHNLRRVPWIFNPSAKHFLLSEGALRVRTTSGEVSPFFEGTQPSECEAFLASNDFGRSKSFLRETHSPKATFRVDSLMLYIKKATYHMFFLSCVFSCKRKKHLFQSAPYFFFFFL